MTRRWTIALLYLAHLMVLVLAVSCLASPAMAAVVGVAPAATTTLSNTAAGQSGVTYTFGAYQETANVRVVGVNITFPVDTDLTGASVAPAVGAWTRTDQTIYITFPTFFGRNTPFSFSVDNVKNRTGTGTFSDIQLVFRTQNNGGKGLPDQPPLSAGPYTIAAAPYISMTITTPDLGQSVDFGAIPPAVTTGPKTVNLQVLSSAQYTISRTVTDPGGAVAKLGMVSSWAPAGTLGVLRPAAPATPATFTDTFTLTPPWTTDPEQLLAVSVTYTVVQ